MPRTRPRKVCLFCFLSWPLVPSGYICCQAMKLPVTQLSLRCMAVRPAFSFHVRYSPHEAHQGATEHYEITNQELGKYVKPGKCRSRFRSTLELCRHDALSRLFRCSE
jgi:hypothetical protein